MSEADLLGFVERWTHDHEAALLSEGIHARFGRGPEEGRSKSMAYCTLESADSVGELLVWTSGEVEVGVRSHAGQEIDEHHRVAGPPDLESLLERLSVLVSRAR